MLKSLSWPTAAVLLGAFVMLGGTAAALVGFGAGGETIAVVLASLGSAVAAALAFMRSLGGAK